MKKTKVKRLGLALSMMLIVSIAGTNATANKDLVVKENKSQLKQFTVSEEELDTIVSVAKGDATKAADMVNELEGYDFEAAVNKVLTEYYKNEEENKIEEFSSYVDKKAANIVKGYEEAAIERAMEEKLPYEADASLICFGKDITIEEIENIVKDQYGECEYIHKCPDDTYLVKVKNSLGMTVDKAVKAYGKYAETTHIARNDKVEQIAEAYEFVNDTYVHGQYYLRTMNVVDTWQYIRGRNHAKIKVAVIDGGADLNSADLRGSSDLSAEILNNNAYIPLRQSSSMYNNSHGTTVAGVLAGTANNNAQIAGVASCINNDVAELINVKIEMYVDKIAVGIDYSLQVGAKVINLSLAHDGANSVEEAAINRFVAAGGTVVAGAGNSATDALTYPSDYANVIGVVSVDEWFNIAGSSNRGWNKDICAPGVNIYAPNITGQEYDTIVTGGTSLASPMVAAVVTMMYSVNQGLNSETVRNILRNTATDIGEPGRDYTYAYGFVNAYSAVVTAGGGTTTNPTTSTQAPINGPQEVFGQMITSNTNGIIDVVWGAASNGQTYNVYLDGSIATDIDGTALRNIGCAAYRIPASAGSHTVKITSVLNGQESAGVSVNVTVAGTVEVTTTTASPSTKPGYVVAGSNWTELNNWSVYLASGWGNDPMASYKDGGNYSDFGLYVDKESMAAWGIQLKTKVLEAEIGKTYICKVTANFNQNMSNTILFKDEGTQVSNSYTLINGENSFEIEFTPTDNNTQIFFDLGMLPNGGNFVITSFSLMKKEQPTEPPTTEEPTTRIFDGFAKIEAEHFTSNQGGVIDINGNASGGYNIGGVINLTTMVYNNVNFSENAGGVDICYSSPVGTANGNVQIYVDSPDNMVGEIVLHNNGSSWQEYGNTSGKLNKEITAGNHTIYVKYVTTGGAYYVANVDYFKFMKASEFETEPPTEQPTEEETTVLKTIEGGIEINGYQISATAKGMRTIYSVDSEINGKAVVSSGIVYSLAELSDEEDMFVGSTSEYVRSYESTAVGEVSEVCSDSDIATSYAMTMRFSSKVAKEYTESWRICAYAQLSDGSYVYTDAITYTIYDVADNLYQSCKMSTKERHDYLYNDILAIVNKEYVIKDYYNTSCL